MEYFYTIPPILGFIGYLTYKNSKNIKQISNLTGNGFIKSMAIGIESAIKSYWIRHTENRSRVVNYKFRNKNYIMMIKPTRGPSPFYGICDGMGNDIYDDVMQYLGPNYNFHNFKMRPRDMGYDEIIFKKTEYDSYLVKRDDIIKILEILE